MRGLANPRLALAALLALTAIRLAVAAAAPLSPDEAYYWVWSRALAPGYLDHPPMVALFIRAGISVAGDTTLGIRLLAPLSALIGSLMLFRAAEALVPRAGIPAVALLNATLLFGAGAVTMTPDTPLLLFWTAGFWVAAEIARGGGLRWWLLAGLAAGLAMDSKYTAALLPAGLFLWVLATPSLRPRLGTAAPWLAALLALCLFLPVLGWNAAHGWASFAKQGGRIGDFQPARALGFMGELVGGQLGLATPLIFLLLAAGVWEAWRAAWRVPEPGVRLITALTLPPVLVFAQHALGDRVQANWPAIVYPAASVAAASLGVRWQPLRGPALALGGVLTLLVYADAVFMPLSLPPRFDPVTLRLAGWDGLAAEVDAARRAQGAAFVAADNYGVAAELARRLPPGVQVVGMEPRWATFSLPSADIAGKPGLLVRSRRRGDDIDRSRWQTLTPEGDAARTVNGVVGEAFGLYRGIGRDGGTDAVSLPRPAR